MPIRIVVGVCTVKAWEEIHREKKRGTKWGYSACFIWVVIWCAKLRKDDDLRARSNRLVSMHGDFRWIEKIPRDSQMEQGCGRMDSAHGMEALDGVRRMALNR